MPMNLEEKKQYVADLQSKLDKASSFFVLKNEGVPALDMTLFRKDIKDAGGEFKVVKKTLVRRALDGTSYLEHINSLMEGPVGFVFAYEDAVSVAKLIKKKIDDGYKFEIKGGILGEKVLSPKEVETLAKLPSKEELIAQFVGLLAAPLRNLVGVLSGVQRDFVLVLNEIKKKKEGA